MRQNQAPPAEGETVIDRLAYDGPRPRPFDVWPSGDGWCSACLVDEVPIVSFGSDARCVGICKPCLERINKMMPVAVALGSPTSSADGEKP